MLRLANEFADDAVLNYDVCIVGSGPAAITLATQLAERSLRIVLLESGAQRYNFVSAYRSNAPFDQNVQPLYDGELEGWLKTHQPNYLSSSRLRGYGGTGNVWSGWCWPLEPHDFEDSRLRPGTAWPINYQDLHEYYERAQGVCQLDAYRYDTPDYWPEQVKSKRLEIIKSPDASLRTRIIQFNPLNFRDHYHEEIESSPAIDLLQNANVVEFEAAHRGNGHQRVSAAVVRTIENGKPGRTLRVSATQFVLAAGAVESTRLLLLSGLGNSSGHLGKHFTEHPYIWTAARFDLATPPQGVRNFYFNKHPPRLPGGTRILAALVPSKELLEAEHVGNFRVFLGGADDIPGTISANIEQHPNEESFISLSDSLPPDIFGRARVKITAHLSETDRRTARTLIEVSRDFVERLGYGSNFQVPDLTADPLEWPAPFGLAPGNHPMGTTRMSAKAKDGVVDSDCRVHDTSNLYVASSSVFPVGGYANPTLTLVALAIRLADHLKGSLTT